MYVDYTKGSSKRIAIESKLDDFLSTSPSNYHWYHEWNGLPNVRLYYLQSRCVTILHLWLCNSSIVLSAFAWSICEQRGSADGVEDDVQPLKPHPSPKWAPTSRSWGEINYFGIWEYWKRSIFRDQLVVHSDCKLATHPVLPLLRHSATIFVSAEYQTDWSLGSQNSLSGGYLGSWILTKALILQPGRWMFLDHSFMLRLRRMLLLWFYLEQERSETF